MADAITLAHLLTLVKTLRPLLPAAVDAPDLNTRTALEALDAILERKENAHG